MCLCKAGLIVYGTREPESIAVPCINGGGWEVITRSLFSDFDLTLARLFAFFVAIFLGLLVLLLRKRSSVCPIFPYSCFLLIIVGLETDCSDCRNRYGDDGIPCIAVYCCPSYHEAHCYCDILACQYRHWSANPSKTIDGIPFLLNAAS